MRRINDMETTVNVQIIIDKFAAHNAEITKQLVISEIQRDALSAQIVGMKVELEALKEKLKIKDTGEGPKEKDKKLG